MVRSASCQPTFLSAIFTTPFTSLPTTMFRPLNSAIARTTVRMSAPSTSMLKVPAPVRTRPTCCIVLVCAAAGGADSARKHVPAIRARPVRALPTRIGLFSLPRQWNGNRLCLSVRCELHHHRVAPERLDDAVHDLVADVQHHA